MAEGIMEIEEESWVVDLNKELAKINVDSKEVQEELWNKPSIYKLPACFLAGRTNYKKSYMPQMVSFGPYHHKNEQLKNMEYHKHRALRHFLHRSQKTLQTLVHTLKEDQVLVQRLMDSYDSLDEKWRRDQNEFLKLMILDGCFMLEILQWAYKAHTLGYNHDPYYAKNDPVFSRHGRVYVLPHIRTDMLMLENQLPMLLLKILLAVETGKHKEEIDENYLNKIILSLVNPTHNDNIIGRPTKQVTYLHILDVYRKSFLNCNFRGPGPKSKYTITSNTDSGLSMKRVENLQKAGIKLMTSDSSCLNDISFHRGVLKLPTVDMDDTFESTFLNLIAFERFHSGLGNEITSYLYFMDNLIDSKEDVEILREKKILNCAIGSNSAVANLFNEITKDVTPDMTESGQLLEGIQDELNRYSGSRRNKWFADLKLTYFRSPWALMSLLAAIVLLILTVLQTFYTVYGYYTEFPKKKPLINLTN